MNFKNDNIISPNFRKLLYTGKNKSIYQGHERGMLILKFNNSISDNSSIISNKISSFLFQAMADIGIKNHFIRELGPKEQIIQALEIFHFDVLISNIVTKQLSIRLGLEEGTKLSKPIFELFSKISNNKDFHLIANNHAEILSLADAEELEIIEHTALRINDFLQGLFKGLGMHLSALKLNFGRLFKEGDMVGIIPGGEISPRNFEFFYNDLILRDEFDKDFKFFEFAKRANLLRGD